MNYAAPGDPEAAYTHVANPENEVMLLGESLWKRLVKDHNNTSDPAVRAAYGRLAGIVGIGCNLLLFVAKLVTGLLSGSVSVTADAVNNLSDASSSVVTFVGFRMAARPADKEHPYGHARMEYFSGLIVALIILVIGVELAKTSIGKILRPEAVEFSWVLAVVLGLSVLVKLGMMCFYRSGGKRIGSATLRAAAADSRNDVITTLAVLISCIVGEVTGLRIDGYMGLLVALFILWSGVLIARDTLDPLLGAAPDEHLVENISGDLLEHPSVLGIHDLLIHDYGPGRQFASVHAEIDCRMDVLEAHEILDWLERQCMEKYRVLLTIHYDPVDTDDETLNHMRRVVETAAADIDPRLSIHDVRLSRGSRRKKLVFDVAVPFDMMERREEIRACLGECICAEDPDCRVYIRFDEGEA